MECERSSSSETGILKEDAGNRHRRSSTTVATGRRRRMYECTFCKRGFTNAQALGGHMNIHRRDRAKAKQNANASASAEEEEEEEDESLEQFHYINPNTSTVLGVKDHAIQRCLSEPEVTRTSLSLGISLNAQRDENIERIKENVDVEGDEIDLELRLGS